MNAAAQQGGFPTKAEHSGNKRKAEEVRASAVSLSVLLRLKGLPDEGIHTSAARSEERRVGKEC